MMMTTLRPHLFSPSGDDALYDTRDPDWTRRPLRRDYMPRNTTIRSFRDVVAWLRHGPYAWPGGYPMFFLTADGNALSFEGVRANLRELCRDFRDGTDPGGLPVEVEINWEDNDLFCEFTSKPIECAYGEPDAEEE